MNLEISKETSQYMYNFIKDVIDECGPRMPCSPAEAKGAEFIKKEMEKICDEVEIEPFKCHPRAFLGWIRIVIGFMLLSMALYLLLPIIAPDQMSQIIVMLIAVCLNIVAFLILWNEFFNYREFIDPLFKKKDSQNVVGTIKAHGDLKKIIIFSGHHDSALQFNLLRYMKAGYGIMIFWGFTIMFIWIFSSVIILIWIIIGFGFSFAYNNIIITIIIGSIPITSLFFFVSRGEKANKVPGAIDNLSAVAVALGVGQYLKDHKEVIPKNTEIRLLSYGCEEAGLRGAYRYAARHKDELLKYDAEVFNMDGVQSPKGVQIVEYEPTTRTKHSSIVVEKMHNAANLVGVNSKDMGSSLLAKIVGQISGGTDATAFSKAGIKAANLASMEIRKFLSFYHQPTDDINMVNVEALTDALKVCIGYLINESKN